MYVHYRINILKELCVSFQQERYINKIFNKFIQKSAVLILNTQRPSSIALWFVEEKNSWCKKKKRCTNCACLDNDS